MTRLPTICAVLATSVLLCLTPRSADAADDPSLTYYTITTPHFYVHYYDGLESLAKKVAVTCEEAHEVLTPLMKWEPAQRTHVYVNDKVDTANGSATVYGRPHINIFGMPPEADSTLGFYDDWIRILVFHEYVHILHLDTIGGVPAWVNRLIGKQWSPSQTLPRWYVEGLATYHESRRTRGGRVDSSLLQAWLRVAALEDEFFDLGTVTGTPVDWPGGTAYYLYGSFFLDYVFERHGEDVGAEFNHIYGRRMIPWSLNQISDTLTGETFAAMWEEWTATMAARARAERVAVEAAGRTPLEWITDGGGGSGFPRVRPHDGAMTFYHSSLHDEPAFAVVRPARPDYEELFEPDRSGGAFDWTPDGRYAVFAQARVEDNAYRYLDLHVRDTRTGAVRRITEAERAREPAISPDGEWLVYVRNRAGTMELVRRRWKTPADTEEILLSGREHRWDQPQHWQQISMPRFSPDGSRIVFSRWRLDTGQRDLWLYDFEAEDAARVRQLTDDFAVDVDPVFGPDGLVYFSSDRTGIYNIYAMELETGEVWQLSNVFGGVFQPAVSPDGEWIYVRAYGPEGYDLARFRRPTRMWRAAPTSAKEIEPLAYPEVDTSKFEYGKYRPFRFLGPLLLKPEFGIVQSGVGIGASLEGYDPVRRHEYELSAGITRGSEIEDFGSDFGFRYAYDHLPLDIGLSGRIRDFPRTRDFFAESRWIPFIEREYLATVRLSYPFIELDEVLSLGVSYDVNYTAFQDRPAPDHEPGDLEPSGPEQGWFNELGVSLNYSAFDRSPRAVSTERGIGGRVGIGIIDPALGADFHTITMNYGAGWYIPIRWWDHHVFHLDVRGAITLSDQDDPRRYFIGGNRPQDVFTSMVFQRQRFSLVLPGYPPGFTDGSQYQLTTVDYRFPIADFDRGFGTVPIFFRRLKGSVAAKGGGAFDGYLADAEYLTSVGAELSLEHTLAYYVTSNLRLGFFRGLSEGGINEFYLLYGGGF